MGLPTLHARGTFITQFESGFGAWNQLVPDGAVIGSSVPTLQTPISVTTGGTDAKVLYAGGAPGLVNGLVVVTAEIPGVTRYFSSITAATDEIKNARVFAGIHFRTATNHGQTLGVNVADWAQTHALLPLNGKKVGQIEH